MDGSFFTVYPGAIEFRHRCETARAEAWVELGLRAAENLDFTPENWDLSESVSHVGEVGFDGEGAFFGALPRRDPRRQLCRMQRFLS